MPSMIHLLPPRTILYVFTNLPERTHAQLVENNIVMHPAHLDMDAELVIEISST